MREKILTRVGDVTWQIRYVPRPARARNGYLSAIKFVRAPSKQAAARYRPCRVTSAARMAAASDTIFSDTYWRTCAQNASGAPMPAVRAKKSKRTKRAAIARVVVPARPTKSGSKPSGGNRSVAAEIARMRAEAEAAVADARKSHERLREAIDILPQGIVFLDADGRYISGTRSIRRYTAAVRTCSSRARGCRTPSA